MLVDMEMPRCTPTEKPAIVHVMHMHCCDNLDHTAMRLTHKFYENKVEKSYILGKRDAYESMKEIIENHTCNKVED